MKITILLIIFLGAIAVFVSAVKSGHMLKNIFSGTFQGIMSLLAVNVIGLFTGVTIAMNWYTIAFVSVFGTPSCIALLLIDTILR